MGASWGRIEATTDIVSNSPRATGGTFVIHRRAVKRAPQAARGLVAKPHTMGGLTQDRLAAHKRLSRLDRVCGRVPDVVDPRRTIRDRRRVFCERHLLPRLLGLALPIPHAGIEASRPE